MIHANIPVISAADNTGTVVSAAIDARLILQATAQAVFTDNTAAGSLKLQASNDVPAAADAPSHWNDIANTSVSVTSGATAITPPLAANFCFQWIRVAFVSSGGAGTLTVNLHTMGE